MDERMMLEELVRVVAERASEVSEGHNLFRFDLEYLETCARLRRVKLALGWQAFALAAVAASDRGTIDRVPPPRYSGTAMFAPTGIGVHYPSETKEGNF